MEFTLGDLNNVNTLFVGSAHSPGEEGAVGGGNLFFGDAASFSPKVIDYVLRRFCVRSVLDVGSGRGHLPYYVHHQHHIPVIGLEGLPFNVQNAVYPLVLHDFAHQPYQGSPVDLVTCVEVVEHIAPEHVDNLIATLTTGNLLLMTHALPGTNGEFHVNEQPSSYWIEKLNAAGFGLLLQDTQIIRRLSMHEDHMPGYFAQSALMFGRLPVKLPTKPASHD